MVAYGHIDKVVDLGTLLFGKTLDVPEGVKSFIGFSKVFQNGKPQTVPHGGGSIGIMHEFFHVSFEGKNQRKINRYDNKVRNVLGVPKRSVDDPEHNSGTN